MLPIEKLREQRFMLFSLVSTGLAILVSELISKETATVFTNWIFEPVAGAVVVLAIISAKKHGIKGSHGKAWISFVVFSASWFIAETVWMVLELFYHQKPFPSLADVFYLAGYPAYFIFVISYLRPFKNGITKKMVTVAILFGVAVLVPNLYMTFDNNTGEDQLSIVLGASYPVADVIVLVPAIIGMMLFLGGRVNFMWTLMLLGIILEVIADTGFQYFSLDDSIYTGHPIDILFLWSYILFSFGIYDHIKVFKTEQKSYSTKEDLR
ncbi:MAG TPA: hypothetical protein VJR22_02840 [Candidatus Nitrosotalea sp.]|nr:hypothetical protein [Nitrososphaerota archaeon]HKU32767.1 hypothetical protein [Candidatus Nitrosotalea sp.]